ncbi:Spy/CpxP family protein refolding chaperone [Bradyrhizobium sp. Tv2a-2]|uniref:Spy/CpxP family protein refolding chaperone n=1 Tax=Bradyrhizobium sp. Tv2a-2 TaxID=113395 RepID=UPI0003FF8827|nr:Spy/CpxP family protein refolding chaperone [Bradyrhizobium sp. Tv2a-2]
MRRFAIAGMAALAIAASTAVYAQQGWFREHMHHMRLSPEDRAAMLDARIAAVHAGLKLTPDQDKLWPPVESAVRDFAKLRMDRANARMRAREDAQNDQETPPDPVARLRQRADDMATTSAALKKIADAADPLYKTLDDGQKRRLALLTHHGRMGGGGEGWRHRWMERDGGGPRPDRDGGPERL